MSSSQRAAADLAGQLEKVIALQKNQFKMLGQEADSYWKRTTNFAQSYYGVLDRQHEKSMNNLRQEQKIKEENIQKEVKDAALANQKIEASRREYKEKERNLIEIQAGRERRLSNVSTMFGGVQQAAGIALPSVGTALSGFGDLIASTASGVTLFSTAIVLAARATVAYQERQTELARSAAGLVSAGAIIGTTGMGVENLRTKLFSGVFEKLLSPTEQRAGVGALAQSPALLGEATDNTEKFQKALFMFGNIMPNSTELLEMFSKNSKDLGLNLDELTNVFTVSRLAAMKMSHSQKEFNINQKDTLEAYLSLTKTFRTFTTDGHAAAATLLGLSSYLKDVTKGPREKREFAEAIGGGIANLKFSQLAGMFAFTHGGELPNEKQMQNVFRNPGALMGGFLQGITSQFGKGSTESMMVKGQLQEQFFPNLPMRLIPKFDELIESLSAPGITDKEAQAKMAQFDNEAAKAEEAGRKSLTDATTGLATIENKLLNLWSGILNDPLKSMAAADIASNLLTGNVIGTATSVARSMQGARHK
jgi:hypothetical protein